jgi:hypothetical protein
MKRLIYPEAYFRFNYLHDQEVTIPPQRDETVNPESNDDKVDKRSWREKLFPVIRSTMKYLKEEEQVAKLKSCAAILARQSKVDDIVSSISLYGESIMLFYRRLLKFRSSD